SGNAYVTGTTSSANFPTLNALQPRNNSTDGSGDAFIAKLSPTVFTCTYSLSPGSQFFQQGGGSGSVMVSAPAGCAWNVVSDASWLTSASVGSSGSGTVSYSVAANPTTNSRTGTLTIA